MKQVQDKETSCNPKNGCKGCINKVFERRGVQWLAKVHRLRFPRALYN